MIPGGGRRAGKLYAQRRWVEVQRELGTHSHLMEPHSRVVCLNGQCPDLPTRTTDEETVMTNPTQGQLLELLERKRDRVQRELDRRLHVRTWLVYAIALAVVVCTIVLGLAVQSAHSAPSCASDTTVARIHTGQLQRRVERHTGAGQRVLQDQLVYGVEYASCDASRVLVVLYMRGSHRVASVIYTAA